MSSRKTEEVQMPKKKTFADVGTPVWQVSVLSKAKGDETTRVQKMSVFAKKITPTPGR
jgi:hypothetical protein